MSSLIFVGSHPVMLCGASELVTVCVHVTLPDGTAHQLTARMHSAGTTGKVSIWVASKSLSAEPLGLLADSWRGALPDQCPLNTLRGFLI